MICIKLWICFVIFQSIILLVRCQYSDRFHLQPSGNVELLSSNYSCPRTGSGVKIAYNGTLFGPFYQNYTFSKDFSFSFWLYLHWYIDGTSNYFSNNIYNNNNNWDSNSSNSNGTFENVTIMTNQRTVMPAMTAMTTIRACCRR